jgi:peptidoglycan/xylan/chitin deacetylase (PgdA/CDA1 family)
MAAKLDAIGYECQVKVYETNHGFRGKRSELNDELIKWFDAHLKGVPKADYRKIAITIDDVPNTAMFHKDNYHSRLLEVLDSLRIPVSIFINEGLITKTGDVTKNLELLEDWVKKAYVAIGNHTFSHLRYSEVGYGPFKKDIEDGDVITRPLAIKFNKSLAYFRFPYNDLGIDSVQQVEIRNALNDLKYKIAPFTVESSDWMFNAVYEYYLTRADFKNARKIGELYVSKTVEYIHFFDSLSNAVYGRNTSQIYLCHDNRLNSDYLKEILGTLASEGYQFISMDEAIQDPVYNQENRYYKKWGISWFYRWMSTQEERRSWMELEPSLEEIEVLYKAVLNAK